MDLIFWLGAVAVIAGVLIVRYAKGYFTTATVVTPVAVVAPPVMVTPVPGATGPTTIPQVH